MTLLGDLHMLGHERCEIDENSSSADQGCPTLTNSTKNSIGQALMQPPAIVEGEVTLESSLYTPSSLYSTLT